MPIVRYRPYQQMLTMQDEMNRLMDSFFHPSAPAGPADAWYPTCDVRETETEFLVRAELPGVAREDVKINIINSTLVLRGEKKQETEEKKGSWHHVERTYGAFERTFALPTAVAADKIKARMSNGVLEIVVPKAEEARPRQIQIES